MSILSGNAGTVWSTYAQLPLVASVAAHTAVVAAFAVVGPFQIVDTGLRAASDPIAVSIVYVPQTEPVTQPVEHAVAAPAPPAPSVQQIASAAPRPFPPQPEPEPKIAKVTSPAPQLVASVAPSAATSAMSPPVPENARAAHQASAAGAAAPATSARAGPDNPHPLYPGVSRRRGEEGRVVLRVEVEHDGRVANLSVAHSSGFRRLDEAALSAVHKWRFEPARRDGAAIRGVTRVPIRFVLQ